uniref:NnrU domain-containing protein n=1 Tax=Ditylum brightwellii TaxID=49249 RepID=A0A7S1ZUY0_9STRA|mmetsp:Transcript_39434/g.59274  ORF Transcript_39434/g.59274 Transcript_39434/m.59274 type:complete len:441 (+) Transcript_39434:92-1414(+)
MTPGAKRKSKGWQQLFVLMIGSSACCLIDPVASSSTLLHSNSCNSLGASRFSGCFVVPVGSKKHCEKKLQHYDGSAIKFCGLNTKGEIGSSESSLIQRGRKTALSSSLSFTPDEQTLAFWIASFSISHIGMSAQRNYFIQKCGDLASSLQLVGTGLTLPDYWPGDTSGNDIFPDTDTAGRQFYRLGYTIVSFATLGSALTSYLALLGNVSPLDDLYTISQQQQQQLYFHHGDSFYFWVAATSFGAAIASLFNASPLSLMPEFQKADSDNSSPKSPQQNQQQLPIKRNDLLKLEPKGLTRITRHPLILPVVPWGIATSQIAPAGNTPNILFFGGLALYAICGCYAQDLRVVRQEGSVGTTFSTSSSSPLLTNTSPLSSLQTFFQKTSFVPFGAVLDGRQSLTDIIREVPWLGFIFGCIVGAYLEDTLLNYLSVYASTLSSS